MRTEKEIVGDQRFKSASGWGYDGIGEGQGEIIIELLLDIRKLLIDLSIDIKKLLTAREIK